MKVFLRVKLAKTISKPSFFNKSLGAVLPHRSLNYSQGIIPDRDHDISDPQEQEIYNELKNQNIEYLFHLKNYLVFLITFKLTDSNRLKADLVPAIVRNSHDTCLQASGFNRLNKNVIFIG